MADLVIVSVQDEDARRGVGESQSSPAILAAVMGGRASRILQKRLPEIVQGRDPADWESLLDEVLAITRVIGREGADWVQCTRAATRDSVPQFTKANMVCK